MSINAMIFLALGMAMDSFAVNLARGAALSAKPNATQLLRNGMIFSITEMCAPLLGFALGTAALGWIADWDHWIAFILLSGLGVHMLYENRHARPTPPPTPNTIWLLFATAIGTSVDSMIIGVSLAFLSANIWIAALFIGIATLIMATLGLWLGHLLGNAIGRWARMGGALTLIIIGIMVLVQHLS